jgi:hypothetical protein
MARAVLPGNVAPASWDETLASKFDPVGCSSVLKNENRKQSDFKCTSDPICSLTHNSMRARTGPPAAVDSSR